MYKVAIYKRSATKQNCRQDFEIFPFCPRFQDFNRDFKILIRFQDFNQDLRILIRFHKISCTFLLKSFKLSLVYGKLLYGGLV